MPNRLLPILAVLAGCQGTDSLEDIPQDPSQQGVAVGTITLTLGGETVDVWYPARGEAGSSDVVLTDFLPDAFVTAIASLDLPTWSQRAVRDAEPMRLEQAVPLVVFSHGFGGFRAQSTQLTAHLASRGFVVVSADHPGRDLATLAPCLVTLEGETCDISGLAGGDPALEDIDAVLGALDDLPEDVAALVDRDRIGVFGHSAGGNTTAAIASQDDRFDAALAMAGGGEMGREIPSLLVAGACDAIVTPSQLQPGGETYELGYWSLDGAGHLAFSDLCLADLGGLADDLANVEGANSLFVGQLEGLATDGCPGVTPTLVDPSCEDGFAPLEETDPALRHLVAAFFEQSLLDVGDGPDPEAYDLLRRP